MSIANDVRFAVRLSFKERGFTAVAVVALALGMAVNSTFFTIVHSITLRGPVADPSALIHVGTRGPSGAPSAMSYADFEDVRRSARTLQLTAAYLNRPGALADQERAAERVIGAYLTADALSALREQPMRGRDFRPEDHRPGAAPVMLISGTLWRSRYAADPAVVGSEVRLNGVAVTVIGILRDGFRFPNDASFWMPLSGAPEVLTQPRGARALGVFGRLADGVSLEQAGSELNAIMARLALEYPATNRGITANVIPINHQFTPRITDPAWLAFIVAGALVLIIACANVANLLLARSLRRSGEMAVRLSLGASRRRIVRQLLVESVVLGALGCGAGVGLSLVGHRLYTSAIPEGAMPSYMAARLDGPVLAVLAVVALATVLVFGLVPALVTSRMIPGRLLADRGSAGTAGRATRRWTTTFLTAEFALTFILIAALVDDVRAALEAPRDEHVVETTGLTTASVTLPQERYASLELRQAFLDRLTAALDAAGVEAVSVANTLPYSTAAPGKIVVDGQTPPDGTPLPDVRIVAAAPRYFETIGAAPVAGRGFIVSDGAPGERVAIVNQRVASMFFPGREVLGRRIQLPVDGTENAAGWMTIVGVVPTIRQGPGADPTPVVYVPLRQTGPSTVSLLVRGGDRSPPVASLLREQVRALDRDLPLVGLMSMEQALWQAAWVGRMSSGLLRSTAVIGVMLALVGLYAVTTYAVAQRTREFGVRMALGAQRRQLAWLIVRRALLQLGVAAAIGVGCTFAWDRAFSAGSASLADPFVLACTLLAMAVVGGLAAVVPARRAARLDPVASLRAE